MTESSDSIGTELGTLNKLLDMQQKVDKTEESEGKDAKFLTELDEAFADFNQIINELYVKYDKTSTEIWNATKRIMILRQKMEKQGE